MSEAIDDPAAGEYGRGRRRGDLDVEFACRTGRVLALRRRRRRVVGASPQNRDAKQGSERTRVQSNHGRQEVPFNNKRTSPGIEERIEEQRQDTAKSSWPLRGWLAGWATLYEKREKRGETGVAGSDSKSLPLVGWRAIKTQTHHGRQSLSSGQRGRS
jgi:hypothetical protein